MLDLLYLCEFGDESWILIGQMLFYKSSFDGAAGLH